ncbi:MAG: ATP-binding protein [Acidimicrobiales bacterium]|nr:ATP-binding protein [Acidimicrobiales bacterium]
MMTIAGKTQPTTEASAGRPTLVGSIQADLVNLSATRNAVESWLTDRVNQQAIEDIVLVFNELLSNAINAAAPQDSVQYRVGSDGPRGANQIRVTVTNFRVETGWINTCAMPEPEAEGGRGLPLAEMYSDSLEILLALDRVEVTATFTVGDVSNWHMRA